LSMPPRWIALAPGSTGGRRLALNPPPGWSLDEAPGFFSRKFDHTTYPLPAVSRPARQLSKTVSFPYLNCLTGARTPSPGLLPFPSSRISLLLPGLRLECNGLRQKIPVPGPILLLNLLRVCYRHNQDYLHAHFENLVRSKTLAGSAPCPLF